MKMMDLLQLGEVKRIIKNAEEMEALRLKNLAADKARAAAILSTIAFKLGSYVDSVEQIRKK